MAETEARTEEQEMAAMLLGKAPTVEDNGMIPHVFVNDKTNPVPFGMLDMFYRGVFTNTLGIMVAKDRTTGDETPVLVGIGKDADGENAVYTIAKVLSAEEASNYLPPDGKGGYVDVG